MLNRSPAGSDCGIIFGRVQDARNTLGSVFLCFVPLISNLVIRGNVPSKVEINGITGLTKEASSKEICWKKTRYMYLGLDQEGYPKVFIKVERIKARSLTLSIWSSAKRLRKRR